MAGGKTNGGQEFLATIINQILDAKHQGSQAAEDAAESIVESFQSSLDSNAKKIKINALSKELKRAIKELKQDTRYIETIFDDVPASIKIDFTDVKINTEDVKYKVQELLDEIKSTGVLELDTENTEKAFERLLTSYVRNNEKLKTLQQEGYGLSGKDFIKNMREQVALMSEMQNVADFFDTGDYFEDWSSRIGSAMRDVRDELLSIETQAESVFESIKQFGRGTYVNNKFNFGLGDFTVSELEQRVELLEQLIELESAQLLAKPNMRNQDFISGVSPHNLSTYLEQNKKTLELMQKYNLTNTKEIESRRQKIIDSIEEDSVLSQNFLIQAKDNVENKKLYEEDLEAFRKYIEDKQDILNNMEGGGSINDFLSDDEWSEYQDQLNKQLSNAREWYDELQRLREEYITKQSSEFERLSADILPDNDRTGKIAEVYTEILNKITQEGLSASDAIEQLRSQMESLKPIQETGGQINTDDLKLKSLSPKEISTAFKNIDLGGFLNSLNIAKKHTQELKKLFIDLLYINQNLDNSSDASADKWQSKYDEIVKYLVDNGSITQEVENPYEEFYKFMSGRKIKYTEKNKAEFGDDWKSISARFRNVLSSKNGIPVDTLYQELNELFKEFFPEEIKNEDDQLALILDVLGKAREARNAGNKVSRAFTDADVSSIEELVVELYSEMSKNLNAAKDTSKSISITSEESKELEKVSEGARSASQSQEELAEAAERAAERTKQEKEQLEEVAGALVRAGEAHDKIKTVYDDEDNITSKTVTDSRTRSNAIETESKYYTYKDGIETLEATTIVEDFKKRAAELKKEQDKIELAQKTLDKFLSQFENKTAGQASTIQGYNALKNFKIGNLDDIEKATQSMIALDTEYNKITMNFRQGTKSMNPFVNAITGIGEMKNEISKVQISFDSLVDKPEKLSENVKGLLPLFNKMNSFIGKDADGKQIITDIYGFSKAYGELNAALRQAKSDISVQQDKDRFNKNQESAQKKEYEDLIKVQKELYAEKTRLEKAEYGSADAKNLEGRVKAKQAEYDLLLQNIKSSENLNAIKVKEAQLESELAAIIEERRKNEEDAAYEQLRLEEEARIQRENEINYKERTEQIKAEAEAEKERIAAKKEAEEFYKQEEQRIAAEEDAAWKSYRLEQEASAKKEREINLAYEAEAAREAAEAERELAEARKAADEYFNGEDAKVAAENAQKQKELNNLYQERQKIITEILTYQKLLDSATDEASKNAAKLAIESAKGRLNAKTTEIFNYGDLVDEGKLQQQNTMAVEDLRKFNWSKHIKDQANDSKEAYDKLLEAQKKYYDLEKQFAKEEGEVESKRLLDATIAAEKEYNDVKKNTVLTSEQQLELDRKELQYQEELQRIANQSTDKKNEDVKKTQFKNIEDLYDKYLNAQKEFSKMTMDSSGKDHTVSMQNERQKSIDAQKELMQLGIDVNNIQASSILTQEQKNKLLIEEQKHREYLNDLVAKAADAEHTAEAKKQEKINNQNKNYGKSRYNSELRAYEKIMASVRSMEDEDGLSDSFLAKIDKYKDTFKELEILRQKFKTNPSLVKTVDVDGIAFTDKFQDAALKAEELRKEINNIISTSSKLDDIFEDLIIKKTDGPWDTSKYIKAQDAMKAFADEVSNGTFKFEKFNQTGTEMYGTLINSEGAIEKVTIALREASGQIVAFKTKTSDVATDFDRFKSDITSSAKQMIGMYLGFNDIIRYLRQGIEHVREIDAAMTELRKVTDETEASYAKFLDTASAVSSSIGSTVTDFTTVASDFARLGYSIEEAADLAKTALIYENVGDGFSSVEEASESIISTMKAFGIEAGNTMGIVDRFNAVGNNFAITSKGIGDAFQRSASALVEGGNNIDEAIGLVTAANSVIQNPEQVGTALKTLSLRLRSTKVALEEMGEDADGAATSTAKLRANLLGLTGGKVDIMLNKTTFKNTTQILREMSQVWNEMDDISRAGALELMGGKRQANILSSIITNFETVEQVIQTSQNSAGSAIAENEKYLESIQGHIDILNNSVQTMWMNTLNREVIKFFVDIANILIKIVDQAGLLQVAFGTIVAVMSFKYTGIIDWIQKLVPGLYSLTKGLKAGGIAFKFFNSALTGFYAVAAVAAVALIVKAVDKIHKSAKEIAEEADEITKTYINTKKTIDENLKTLTTSSDTKLYATLEDEFSKLAAGVDENGNNMSLTADEYERYRDICKTIVGVNPALASGYDDVTQAVGNNVNALSQLIELQKIEARENAREYIKNDNLKTIAEDAINNYEDALNKVNNAESNIESGYMAIDNNVVSAIDSYFAQATEIPKKLNDAYNEFKEKFYTDGFFDPSKVSNVPEFELYAKRLNDISQDIYGENAIIFDDSWLTEIDLQDSIDDLNSAKNELEDTSNGIIDALLQVPASLAEYDDLDITEKSIINQWIQNSGAFKIDEDTKASEVLKMKTQIKDMVRALSDEDYTYKFEDGTIVSAQDIVDSIYDIDPSTVDWNKYTEQVNELVNYLWQAFGAENNKLGKNGETLSYEDFLKMFGLDFIKIEDDVKNQIINTLMKIKGWTEEEATNFFNNSKAVDVKRWVNVDWNVITNEEELDAVLNPTITSLVSVQTVSALSDELENYKDILNETSDVVLDNTEVTQDYKDSLLKLGISEKELNECFDESNPLIVKNAKALNNLVKASNKNLINNIKLAKSQSRLKYYNLVKQLNSTLKATKDLGNATKNSVYSTLEQIDAVERAIYNYQLLEDNLLGATNAFKEFAKAQEIDAANTYGDSYVEMAQTMYDALYKTGQVGTEAMWSAIESLVPDSVYQQLTDDADRMKAIYDYFNKNILPTLRLDEDQLSIDYDAIKEFVQDGLDTGVFVGNAKDFDLVEGMNLEKAAELMGMTKAQAYALFAELDKYNASGNEQSFLSQLDDSLEGKITKITNKVEDLNRQKLALLEDGGYEENKAAIDEINQKLSQSEVELSKLGKEAYTTWQEYTKNEAALAALDLIEDKQKKLTRSEANMLGIEWDEAKELTVQEAYDRLLAKQLQLEEPTILTAQLAIENIDSKIAELETLLAEPKKLKVEAEESGKTIDELKADIEQQVAALKEDKVAIATTFGIELSEEDKKILEKELNEIEEFTINDKKFWVILNGYSDVMMKLQNLSNYTGDTTKTITTEYKYKYMPDGSVRTPGSGGRYIEVNGTAHAHGTAYASGNWGAPRTEEALVGELGTEIMVNPRTGTWHTIGDNGAEFTTIPKGAIIFNHKQTEDLLSKGYVTGRGKAYASGTAYSSLWQPTSPKTAQSNAPGNDFTEAGQKLYDAADSISTASDSLSDSADDAKNAIDFIEIKLEEIEAKISKATAKLELLRDDTSQTKYKDNIYNQLINAEKNKANTYLQAYDVYSQKADYLLSQIPSKYRAMAKNGAIAIADFVGENETEIADAINEYREWATKADEVETGYYESLQQQAAYRLQQIEDIADDFENLVQVINAESTLLQSEMDLITESGGRLSENHYNRLIELKEAELDRKEKEKKQLQRELNNALAEGTIEYGTDEWYQAIDLIASVDDEIVQCQIDMKKFSNEAQNIQWDNLDRLIERFDALDSQISHLYDRFTDNDKVVDDKGNWTNEGIAAMGMLVQQMEIAKVKSDQYADAIKQLNKDYKKGLYSPDEYNEKLAELTEQQWESIEAYEDAKDSLVDLNKTRIDAVKDGMQKELDKLKELIDKKKELLDADKEAYDFEKTVQEQRKNISDLERQLAALRGDTSLSAAAQRKQIEAELLEARAELEETFYEQSIKQQQDSLDDQYEHHEKHLNDEMDALDEYLEDSEKVILDSINTVKNNTSIVLQEIKEISRQYGIDISDSITNPWRDGSKAISDYQVSFKNLSSSFIEELDKIIAQEEELQKSADRAAKALVKTVNQTVQEYTKEPEKKPNKPSPSEQAKQPTLPTETPKEEPKKPVEKAPPTKGDKVTVKKTATHFSSKSGSKKMASFVPGSTYTVYQVSGSQVLIGRNGVYTGWVNLKDLQGYSKGISSVKNDQFAWIDEIGEELVLHAGNDGRLSYLTKGTSVIPADLTEKLMKLAVDPTQTLENSRPIISAPHITNNEVNIDMNIAEVVHIDTVTNDTMPDLTKAIEKQMDKYMKTLNSQIRKYSR